MEFSNTEVFNIEGALRGMRNPLNSWKKSDSYYESNKYIIGDNDLNLAQRLIRAGDEHAKFMRSIFVSVDITAPVYFCSELDTYKIGTTRNSCSLQHKGASRYYNIEDFTADDPDDVIWDIIIDKLNKLQDQYNATKSYKYFRQMRQIMPMGYDYKFTWTANYAILRNLYKQRRNHPLEEWHIFCEWIDTLPYSKELITLGD